MERDKFFDCITYKKSNDKDKLGMILSNNMDVVYNGDVAVSVKKWDDLIEDILKWHADKEIEEKYQSP